MKPQDLDPTGQKIVDAFRIGGNNYKTIEGIAQHSDLSAGAVGEYLQSHPGVITASTMAPGGMRLYQVSPDLKDW